MFMSLFCCGVIEHLHVLLRLQEPFRLISRLLVAASYGRKAVWSKKYVGQTKKNKTKMLKDFNSKSCKTEKNSQDFIADVLSQGQQLLTVPSCRSPRDAEILKTHVEFLAEIDLSHFPQRPGRGVALKASGL